MVHDFIVTRSYVLFPILPLTGDMERAQRGGPAFAWEPERGAYVGVMKRDAGVDTIRWFEVEPGYVFHPMNAWEDGDKIHCDVMEYPSAPLFPRADGSKGEDVQARLIRWTLDLGGATNMVRRAPLDDINGEFPRFDERFAGLPYRHGWYGANIDQESTLELDSLAHIDHRTGKRILRRLPAGDTVSEPVFVPSRKGAPEGDGWILAVVYRRAENRSELLILDAQNIAGEPAAVLEVPRRVPAGFHGNWVGRGALANHGQVAGRDRQPQSGRTVRSRRRAA
jgi:carotenoid cleavage dioxygenase